MIKNKIILQSNVNIGSVIIVKCISKIPVHATVPVDNLYHSEATIRRIVVQVSIVKWIRCGVCEL